MATAARSKTNKQLTLDVFEGQPIDTSKVKFTGDPAQMVDPTARGAAVAFIVVGNVEKVTFEDNEEEGFIRRHTVKMSKILQVDHSKGMELLDEIDRQEREAAGIVQMFDS